VLSDLAQRAVSTAVGRVRDDPAGFLMNRRDGALSQRCHRKVQWTLEFRQADLAGVYRHRLQPHIKAYNAWAQDKGHDLLWVTRHELSEEIISNQERRRCALFLSSTSVAAATIRTTRPNIVTV